MGFLDKAKEAADRAVAATQHATQQGQAKLDSFQSGRSEADLFRALGEAFFNEQRRGADRAPVTDALAALDQHYAATQAAQGPPVPPDPGSPQPGPTSAPVAAPAAPAPAPAPAPAAPTGNFTLDDL